MTDSNGFGFENPEAFTRMWTEFASKMASAGVSFGPESPPPEAARQVRDAMFNALSGYCEEYMRSPQFLATMKQSMDNAIAFRKQMNTYLNRMHHEFQGVSQEDMDGLMNMMSDVQKTVLRRLDGLASRLDTLSERLEQLESRTETSEAGTSSESAAKRSPKRKTKTPSTTKSATAKAPRKRTKKRG